MLTLPTPVARLAHGILDLVYPPFCLVCLSRVGVGSLCETCAGAFIPIPEPLCAVCGRPVGTAPCRNCERYREATGAPFPFDAARAAAVYEGALRRAIHSLKYDGGENLAPALGAFLANRLIADGLLPDAGSIDAVTFVPMHGGRERARGYNQARLLAEPVARMLGVPLLGDAVFVRSRKTAQQVGLSDKARRANVRADAFAVPDPARAAGKRLLLVDDVLTTGATVGACAAVLKAAGAASVTVAALAAGG